MVSRCLKEEAVNTQVVLKLFTLVFNELKRFVVLFKQAIQDTKYN